MAVAPSCLCGKCPKCLNREASRRYRERYPERVQAARRAWAAGHRKPLDPNAPHFNLGRRYLTRGRVPKALESITSEQVAWAAGLFEGEGSVIVESRPGRRVYATPRLQVNSTDHDTILTLKRLMGGRVNAEPQRPPRKDQWRWTLQGYETVVRVWELFGPWLGKRRRSQFESVLAECEQVRCQVSSAS